MRTRASRTASRCGVRRALRWSALLAAAGVALAGCTALNTTPGTGPGPAAGLMAAAVAVMDAPIGGSGVTDLTCSFEVTQLPGEGTDPIYLRVDWTASCGVHKSEVFAFDGGYKVFTSRYEDSSGQPIGMTFWAAISWQDSEGSHAIRSANAVCAY